VKRDACEEEKERNVLIIKENTDNLKIPTEEEKRQILKEYHDAPIGEHQGIERTLRRICLKYNWPGITKGRRGAHKKVRTMSEK